MEIEKVMELYGKRVQGTIKKFFNEDFEDIEQDVYIKTWKNLPTYRGEADFWSWLRRITVNTCKDSLRKKKNMPVLVSDDDENVKEIPSKSACPEKNAVMTERQKLILRSINKLNSKFKEVIILHDIDDLTCEEIAEKIKIPIGTVKSRLFNARKALREELSEILV